MLRRSPHSSRVCNAALGNAMNARNELKALGAVAYGRAWESNCYWVISTRTQRLKYSRVPAQRQTRQPDRFLEDNRWHGLSI